MAHGKKEHRASQRLHQQIGRSSSSSRWPSSAMKTDDSKKTSPTYGNLPRNEADPERPLTDQTQITTRYHDHPDGCHQAKDQSETGTLTNPLLRFFLI